MQRTHDNSADVLSRFGLRAIGFWRSVAVPPPDGGIRVGENLREAFEQLGGLYPAFARFLCWRADLLGNEYLGALNRVRLPHPPVSRERVLELLRQEVPGEFAELSAGLGTEPLWNTLSRTAYLSAHEGKPVVVQVHHDPVTDAAFAEFEAGAKLLGHPDVAKISTPQILRQFREWLKLSDSGARERAYLDAFRRAKGDTLVDYPELIPAISTDHVLCWPFIEGEPVNCLLQNGSAQAATAIATLILEQWYAISIVEAELELDALAVSKAGRLVMRRISRPVSVPPPLVNVGMKYISAVLVGDAPLTVQSLVPIAMGKSSALLEDQLLEQMSGIDPDLKVNLWYPRSASAFESNWRALANMKTVRPLYVDSLHRNLIAVGYWNAEAVTAGAKLVDAIEEAQTPIVTRLLQSQLMHFLNPGVVAEWTVGTGLLGLGAIRESNRLAEEFRENNLTTGLDLTVTKPDPHHSNQTLRRGVLAGLLLIVFLVSIRFGVGSTGVQSILLKTVALGAIAGLFWAVSKIG